MTDGAFDLFLFTLLTSIAFGLLFFGSDIRRSLAVLLFEALFDTLARSVFSVDFDRTETSTSRVFPLQPGRSVVRQIELSTGEFGCQRSWPSR